jgi:hypothetical protein
MSVLTLAICCKSSIHIYRLNVTPPYKSIKKPRSSVVLKQEELLTRSSIKSLLNLRHGESRDIRFRGTTSSSNLFRKETYKRKYFRVSVEKLCRLKQLPLWGLLGPVRLVFSMQYREELGIIIIVTQDL